jgi:hypothetical protein
MRISCDDLLLRRRMRPHAYSTIVLTKPDLADRNRRPYSDL